jgi:hypothetical protein
MYTDAAGQPVAPTQPRDAASDTRQASGSTPLAVHHTPLPPSPPAMASSYSQAAEPAHAHAHQHSRSFSSASAWDAPAPGASPRSPVASSARSSYEAKVAHAALPPPDTRRELLGIFFAQLTPFSAALDEVSFLRDLSSDDVSPVLLLAISALSARFTGPSSAQPWANGESYARAARRLLHDEDMDGNCALDAERPDLDTCMATCFLAAHELGMGRLARASIYMGLCARLVRAMGLLHGHLPSRGRRDDASAARRGTTTRFAVLALSFDVLIALLAGQPPAFAPSELAEAQSTFDGTAATDETAAFLRLLGAMSLLARALDGKRRGSSASGDADVEASLNRWASGLPRSAHFDATNLSACSRALAASDNDGNPSASAAWCWMLMHAAAECTTFLLFAHKRAAAVQNVEILLDGMGTLGLRSPFALLPLTVASLSSGSASLARHWETTSSAWSVGRSAATASLSALLSTSGSPRTSPPSSTLLLPAPSMSGGRSPSLLPPSPRSSDTTPNLLKRAAAAELAPPKPRHHASASGAFLPSLNRLPALRLSPPLSLGSSSGGSGAETRPSPPGYDLAAAMAPSTAAPPAAALPFSTFPRSPTSSAADDLHSVWGPMRDARTRTLA